MNDVDRQPSVALEMAPEVEAVLAAQARGRRLLIDWFATRCCGATQIGDVAFRWRSPRAAIDPDAVRVEGTTDLELWIRPELIPLFARAQARIVVRGFGPWRHPSVVVENGAAWLDFFAACPTRSASTPRSVDRS